MNESIWLLLCMFSGICIFGTIAGVLKCVTRNMMVHPAIQEEEKTKCCNYLINI